MRSTQLFQELLTSPELLLIVKLLGVLIRAFILLALLRFHVDARSSRKSWFLIMVIVTAAIMIEVNWIVDLIRRIHPFKISYSTGLCSIRVGWLFSVIQYLALSLFIDSLIRKEQKFKLNSRQTISVFFGGMISAYFLYLAISSYITPTPEIRPALEFLVCLVAYFYIFTVAFLGIYQAIKGLYHACIPKILSAQLKIFMKYMIFPHLLLEIISFNPFEFSSTYLRQNYFILSVSDILIICSLYFCAKKMMGLRFLNIYGTVQSRPRFNFLTDFKNTIDDMGSSNSFSELKRITQAFFSKAFGVPVESCKFYIRSWKDDSVINLDDKERAQDLHIQRTVEKLITRDDDEAQAIMALMRRIKAFVKDEIEFTHFYEENVNQEALLSLLDELNADVFLPLYEKHEVTGYIIIEKNARPRKLFSGFERDEMSILSNYISNVIRLLKHSNWDTLVREGKELKEEVYNKHQEVNQYKESMRSFFRNSKDRKIGLLFYHKLRKFSYGNQAGQELAPLRS